MSSLPIRAASALLLLVIGASSGAGENDPRVECSFNPRAFRSAEMIFHELSERAELVVPTIHATATTDSRRRGVVPQRPRGADPLPR